MRVIHKKITLEQFKARTPALIDSFDDNGACIDLTRDDSERDNLISCYPMGDYAMIPCDIILDSTLVDDSQIDRALVKSVSGTGETISTYEDVRYDDRGCEDIGFKYYALSYGTAIKMYHFFLEYNKLLKSQNVCNGEVCNQIVSSATRYWEIYVMEESEREKYEEMDEEFKRYGGVVNVVDKSTSDGIDYQAIEIGGMDEFLVKKVFNTFEIPTEYTAVWKTDKLYFVEAMKWYEWFKDRYAMYSGITEEECKQETVCGEVPTIDCIDCKDYFKRGGNDMYLMLKDYIDSFENIYCSSATTSFSLPLYIQNSIEDIGEFTVMSSDWEGGIEYKSDVCRGVVYSGMCDWESGRTSGSTTVVYDSDTWIRNCTEPMSYKWDSICKRYSFNYDAWTRYSVAHSGDTEMSDELPYKAYAYNVDDIVFVFNTKEDASSDEAATELAKKVEVIGSSNGYILYKSNICPIEEHKYIVYPENSDNHILVQTHNGKEFVIYKGRKYWGETIGNTLYFNITKIPCIREGKNISATTGQFVNINGTYIKGNGNGQFTIKNYVYDAFDSYFVYKNNTYYLSDDTLIRPFPKYVDYAAQMTNIDISLGEKVTEADNNTKGYKYDALSKTVIIYTPYEIYEFGVISGRTSSRLSLLKRNDTFCDDVGHEIEGYFEVTSASTHPQPVENSTLDIPYKVGSVSRMTELVGSEGDTIGYWGDYLKEIEFYIANANGEPITMYYSATTFNGNNLDAIEAAIRQRCEDLDSDTMQPSDLLMARFTYYVGAILDYNDNSDEYMLFSESKGIQTETLNGVKYVDICRLYKKPTQYSIHDELAYSIYYYDIVGDIEKIRYSTEIIELPMSDFKVVINTENKPDWISGDDVISFSRFNGLDYSPIFREEYKFGSSSLEKVTDNIYIERAIIKPHEQNLMLLDIHTMDALEKYGNGKINIINN